MFARQTYSCLCPDYSIRHLFRQSQRQEVYRSTGVDLCIKYPGWATSLLASDVPQKERLSCENQWETKHGSIHDSTSDFDLDFIIGTDAVIVGLRPWNVWIIC